MFNGKMFNGNTSDMSRSGDAGRRVKVVRCGG